ncbi:MAG: FHA domain-containing protein [Planctomycetales bacterium]
MQSYDEEFKETREPPDDEPKIYGELIPLGGGDPIPLLKKNLMVGRRERCDVVLRLPSISSHHCRLTVENGYWFVEDLDSLNFTKINDCPISKQYLAPGDVLSIARHKYEIRYSPTDLGATGSPPAEGIEEVFNQSLLERAGLNKQPKGPKPEDFPAPPPPGGDS